MSEQACCQPKGTLIKYFLPGFVLGLVVGGFAGVYVASTPGDLPRVKAGKGPVGATDRAEDIPDPGPGDEVPSEAPSDAPADAPPDQPADIGSPTGG